MLVLMMLATVCWATLADDAVDPYDVFVEQVAKMSELLDRATYLAISGFKTYSGEDQRVVAQSLVNLFEGVDGPNFMSLDTGATTEEIGIVGLYILLREGSWMDWPSALSISQAYAISDALEAGTQFVQAGHVAAVDALDALNRDAGPEDAFRATYAYIVAARGGFDDPFLIGGIKRLAEVVPSRAMWLRPGDSIQEAIDSLPDGGVIHLEAGTYRERIEIEKSLTIQGSSQEDIATGVSVLEGVEWQGAISISSRAPISVAIEGVTIRGSASALIAGLPDDEGAISLSLSQVTFENNETALVVSGESQASCTQCFFDGNESSIWVLGNARVELQESVIKNGEGFIAAVIAQNDAELSMVDCEIENDFGCTIILTSTASLNLVDSSIRGNLGQAINVAGTALRSGMNDMEYFCGSSFGEQALGTTPGEITGHGNVIYGLDLPADLDFLTAPNPDDE